MRSVKWIGIAWKLITMIMKRTSTMHIDLHDIESITSNYTTLTSGTVVKTLRIIDISGNKYTINLYSKKRKNLKAKKEVK
jgi:hypothetical protein